MNFIRERRQGKTIISHHLSFHAQRPWSQVSFAAGKAHAQKEAGMSGWRFKSFRTMAACVADNSKGIELEKLLENRNDQEETEEKTDDSSFPSEEEIFNQIKDSFSESIAKSFRGKKLFWRQIIVASLCNISAGHFSTFLNK